MSLKPICVPCRRFYRCKENGFKFVEAMPIEAPALAGNSEPRKWKPYKIWAGDLWQCPDCGAETVVGVAVEPIAEHYEPNFAEVLVAHRADRLQVNDC